MNSTENILNQSISKIKETTEKMFSIGPNKLASSGVSESLNKELKLFNITASKMVMSHKANSKELNETMATIKKAKYDLDQMPSGYKNAIEATYNDFKKIHSQDPKYYENTFISTYMNMYETATSVNYKNFVKKFSAESKSFSGESLSDFNTLISQENFFLNGFGKTLGTAAGKVAAAISPTTAIIGACSIIITIMIVILSLVAMSYLIKKKKLVDIQLAVEKMMSDDEIMINKAVKPMIPCTSFIKRMSDNKTFSLKKLFSKESVDDVEMSSEAAVSLIVMGALYIVLFLVPNIRSLIYFVKHLKLRMHEFFMEQAEMLLVNIDELEEKIMNTKDASEKARLQKIIDKQRGYSDKLYKLSESMYKETLMASYKVDDELSEDDTIYKKTPNKEEDNTSDTSLNDGLPAGSVLF